MYEMPPDLLLKGIAQTLEEVITPSLPTTYLKAQATAMGTMLRFLSASLAKYDTVIPEINSAAEGALKRILEALGQVESPAAQKLPGEIQHGLESAADLNQLEKHWRLNGALAGAIQQLDAVRLSVEARRQVDDGLAGQLRLAIQRDLEIYDTAIATRTRDDSSKGNRTRGGRVWISRRCWPRPKSPRC